MNPSKKVFSLENLTFREFETFLIILAHEGHELSVIKKFIDQKFQLKSRTKSYDYINELSKKGLVYKEEIIKNGKKKTKVCIGDEKRKQYEEFIIPTISSLDQVNENLKKLFKENLKELSNLETIRDKIKNYTEIIVENVCDLIEKTPVLTIKKKRFLKTVEDMIWGYFKAEMLKYEFFSK